MSPEELRNKFEDIINRTVRGLSVNPETRLFTITPTGHTEKQFLWDEHRLVRITPRQEYYVALRDLAKEFNGLEARYPFGIDTHEVIIEKSPNNNKHVVILSFFPDVIAESKTLQKMIEHFSIDRFPLGNIPMHHSTLNTYLESNRLIFNPGRVVKFTIDQFSKKLYHRTQVHMPVAPHSFNNGRELLEEFDFIQNDADALITQDLSHISFDDLDL